MRSKTIKIAALAVALGVLTFSSPRAASVSLFGPRVLTRTTGAPNVFTFTFPAGMTKAPYVLHIDNHGVTSAVVTLNGRDVLRPQDFKSAKAGDWVASPEWVDPDANRTDEWRRDRDWKGVLERVVAIQSTNTLRVELASKPGTHLSIRISGEQGDITPPTITASADPGANAAGWNRADVTVTFACSDDLSGVATCPAAQTITTEGAGQIVQGTAIDNAGNTAAARITLNIDKTAPTIAAATLPAIAAGAWVNQDVTVSFTCADDSSGVASCAPARTVTEEGAHTISGTVTDAAGNTASTAATFSIDKTAPVILAAVAPELNSALWTTSTVTVSFQCADTGSDIAVCPPPITVSSEGANQTVSATAFDRAGNSASAAVTVNIDRTVPTITATILPEPNELGWNDSNVTVAFVCADTLSDIAVCPGNISVPAEGAGQVVTGEAVDRAGNKASTSVTLNIDTTSLTVTPSIQPPPNSARWNNTDVVVSFTCDDSSGAGVETCPSPVTVTAEGRDQAITGTARDRAGNTATAIVRVSIDKSAPLVTPTPSTAPNANGWIVTDATVTFTCEDPGGSGIATCPPPIALGEGGGQTISGTAVDIAGNSASAGIAVSVDRTLPTITATVTPPSNDAGWWTTDVVVAFVCDDAVSGVKTCPPPVTVSDEGANHRITGTATDRAGLSASTEIFLNIDKTPATITAAVEPAAEDGWHQSDVVVVFICSGADGGALTCPAPVTVSTEGANQTISRSVTDRAGNTSSASVTLNIDKTAPGIVPSLSPARNPAGWHRSDVTSTFACTDALSGVASCSNPTTVSAEGAAQVVSGTATDKAGNTSTTTATLNIDRTGPIIALTSPTGTSVHTSPVLLRGIASDQLSGIASATCNGSVASLGTDGSFQCSVPLVAGDNVLQATATDAAGNVASSQLSIGYVLNRAPIPTAGSGYTGAVGAAITLSSAGTIDPDNDPLTYTWTFGDGQTATGPTVSHSYSRVGLYTVVLTVRDDKGEAASATTTATIAQPNRAPVSSAGGPYSGIAGLPVAFSGTGSDTDADPLSYTWNFGDGAIASGAAVSHVYAAANTYTVTLTVTDGQLIGQATTSVQIAAANRQPTVTAGGPYAGVNGVAVSFTATGSDPDGDVLTFTWDFGDGTTTIGRTASYSYATAGARTVTVAVTDGRGGTATATASATIAQSNRPPIASVGGPYAGQARSRIGFSASGSSDPDGDTLGYSWDFGDGTSGTGVSPTHGYAAQGSYTVRVTVDDGRGGQMSSVAAVSIAPAPEPVNQPPVAHPGGPYAAEAGVVVSLNGGGSSDPDADALTYAWTFGDGSSGTGAAATHVYATAGTFTVTLTVSDGHQHSTSASTSAAVAPATDRAPPSVTLAAPARVLPDATVTVTANASDDIGVATVTFQVDGGALTSFTAPPYRQVIHVPAVAAPGATITVAVTAIDAAGNRGTAQAILAIDAAPDTEPPTVTLTAPARATAGSVVTLTATAADNVGVGTVEFRAGGALFTTVGVAPYASAYTVPVDALAGSILTLTARAVDFTGNDTTASAEIEVAENSDTTPPTVTMSVSPLVGPGTTMEMAADASDDTAIASVSFYVNGVRIATVTQPPYAASYAVPASALPGSVLNLEARALDPGGLEGRVVAVAAVARLTEALVIGQVLDDSTGLLLAGATVTLRGTDAAGAPYAASAITDDRGRFVIHAAPGEGILRISRDGMTHVDRAVSLRAGTASVSFDARLAPRAAASQLSGVLGGTVSNATGSLSVPGGALPAAAALSLTRLSAQGLPGLLPPGWSPLTAVDVAPSQLALGSAVLAVTNTAGVAPGTAVVLARWDESADLWRTYGVASVSDGGAALTGTIDSTGQYAFLLADTLPAAPPAASIGAPLAGVTAMPAAADAASLVTAQPKIIFYQPGVKSAVTAAMTSPAPLPSGTLVSSRITESYRFRDEGELHPDPYTTDLVLYQSSGDSLRQTTTFQVSPSLAFEPLTLDEGVITVELFAPAAAAPVATIGSDGGDITTSGGAVLHVPAHASLQTTPIQAADLSEAQLGVTLTDAIDFVGAVQVTFIGSLTEGATLSMPVPASLTDGSGLLLVRLQDLDGQTRLVLVGGARIAGDQVVSDLALPGSAARFEGIRVAGRYVVVHTRVMIGFAAGGVLGTDAQPFAGALVATPTLPVVALSRDGGRYIAVGAVGPAPFTAKDLQRFDAGTATTTFTQDGQVVALDLRLEAQPPRVVSVAPADGAANMALDLPVVVTFSKPIDPATLSGAAARNLVIVAADGTVVPATLSLSARNAKATLRPATPLAPNAVYAIVISADIKDLSGYSLSQPVTASFTTLDTTAPLPPPAGAVTASIPVNGSTTVRGTQGTAGAHDRVSIVNLTTGGVYPVLLGPNGGFSTTISASAQDKLRLRIRDAAGNETTLDLPRFTQTNADGSISTAVGNEAAHLEGPAGTAVDISPGTFPAGTVVTIQAVPESEFPGQLTAEQKTVLTYAGGVRLDFGGATPAKYVNVSVPAGPTDKIDDQWIVSAATEVNGRMLMNVVDTAKLINGRIQTSSPPCPGVTGAAVYGIHKSLQPFGLNYGQMYASGYGGLQLQVSFVPVGAFVLLPFGSFTPSYPTPVCLPILSGNVSVGQNRQRLTIAGSKLTPADREIIVTSEDGDHKPLESHFPKDSVYYTFEVNGKDTDSYQVTVTDGTTTVPVANVRVSRATASTILVAFSPDSITLPGIKQIVIRNTTTSGVATFFQQQQAYVVSVPGGEGSVSRVQVLDVNGAGRDLQAGADYSVSAPNGPQNLVVRAVRGTIDPSWSQLSQNYGNAVPAGTLGVSRVTLTESGPATTGTQIVQTVDIPLGAIVEGAFNFPFDGTLSNRFEVTEEYTDQAGNFAKRESINLPSFRVSVANPVTGVVHKTYIVRAPAAGDLIDLGSISDDTTAPYITAGPDRPASFDPAAPLSFTFSEPMQASSVQLNMHVLNDQGTAVLGHWRLSDNDRVATFVPVDPLGIGKTYTIAFGDNGTGGNNAGLSDRAGNRLKRSPLTLKTFLPRLLSHFRTDNDDFTFSAAATKPDMPFNDLAIHRTRENGTLKTNLIAVTGSRNGSKLITIDATDAANPAKVGATFGGNVKQRITLLTGVGTNGVPPLMVCKAAGCDPSAPGALEPLAAKDLAITSSFNTLFSYVSFFNISDLAKPELLANKLLTATPDTVSDFSRQGTVKALGFARGVGFMQTTTGFEAYIGVAQVGAFAVNVGRNIPETLPADRKLEGERAGDYADLSVYQDRVYAVDQSGYKFDVLDPSLTVLSSYSLSNPPRRLTIAPEFANDDNGDGSIDGSEIRTLAVIAADAGGSLTGGAGAGSNSVSAGSDSIVEFLDISSGDDPVSVGSIRLPGLVRDVEVDADKRRMFVAASTNAQSIIYVVDMSRLTPGATASNGLDGRVLWSVSQSSLISTLTLDRERGLLYVSTSAGIDAWAVYDNCCDLFTDMSPKPVANPTGDRDSLVQREKTALQIAIAAGLSKAATQCSASSLGNLTILEQGSGACLWDKNGPVAGCAKNPNYQPGLSDHDFEVFLAGPVDRCVTDALTEQFKESATGARKPITLPDGSKMVFDDITFFPVSKTAFEGGKLDLNLPPAGGDDPNGDYGLGRQQLLLKWLLEGEYIDVPGYNVRGKLLADILKDVAVPALEGYEWSVLQENALVSSKALVRFTGAAEPDSSLHKLYIKQLHSAGKAGIRTALARMVASDAARARLLEGIDRGAYRLDACIAVDPLVADPNRWPKVPCGSFEEWVASSAARMLRGTPVPVFTVGDVAQIHRFYRVKADREQIYDEVKADQFIAGVAAFIQVAKQVTHAKFIEAGQPPTPDPDFVTRLDHVNRAEGRTLVARQDTKVALVPHVANRGFITAKTVEVALWTGAASGTQSKTTFAQVTLQGGDDQYLDYIRSGTGALVLDGEGKAKPVFSVTLNTVTDMQPHAASFTIDLDDHKVKEAFRQNNFTGFFYYALGAPRPLPAAPPAPVAADKLQPDAECEDAPVAQITQAVIHNGQALTDNIQLAYGEHVKVRFTVRNLTALPQTGLEACSTLIGGCVPFPNLGPGEEKSIEVDYVAPATGVLLDATASLQSDTLGFVSGETARLSTGPSPYAVVAVDDGVNPSCLPSETGCDSPSQAMQTGKAFRYYRVVNVRSLQTVAGATVHTVLQGPGVPGNTSSFTTDSAGIIATGGTRGLAIPIEPTYNGDYAVRIADVNGVDLGTSAVRFIINAKPFEFSESIKAGTSIEIGGKLLGGKLTLGAGGGLSLGLGLAKTSSGLSPKSLAIGRSVEAKEGLSWEPALFSAELKAGGTVQAKVLTAQIGISATQTIGDKYTFATMPLSSLDKKRLLGLTLDTAVRSRANSFGPLFSWALKQLDADVGSFDEKKTSESIGASFAGSAGLGLFKVAAGLPQKNFGNNGQVNISADLSGKATVSFSAENQIADKKIAAGIGFTGELGAAIGLNAGLFKAAQQNSPGKQSKLKEEVDLLKLQFAPSASGGVSATVTLDPSKLFDPDPANVLQKIDLTFSGQKNFGWKFGLSDPGPSGEPELVDASSGSSSSGQSSRTYTVTGKDQMLKVLQKITSIGMLLNDAQKVAAGVDPALVANFGPTEIFATVVDFLDAVLEDAKYSDSIERGKGISLPLGFDVTVLAEGLKAEVGLSADHSVSFTTESGVIKNGTRYKLEEYQPTAADMSDATTLLTAYTDALGMTDTIEAAFRDVSRTVDSILGWLVRSAGSAELRLANEGDNAAVKGLLSYDFQPIVGPLRPYPVKPDSVQGDPAKPHYGLGGFHQLMPNAAELSAPAQLILDYHDEEVAGLNRSTIAMYRWNADRKDWDLVPAAAGPAANTFTTTITQLGLFTLAPAMPAGSIGWTVASTSLIDGGQPTERRHISLVSTPLSMNNGGRVPAGALYHVFSAAPGSYDPNGYTLLGTITTPDEQPALEGTQVRVGADGLLHIEIDVPAGAQGLTVVSFSDSGTANSAAPVVIE